LYICALACAAGLGNLFNQGARERTDVKLLVHMLCTCAYVVYLCDAGSGRYVVRVQGSKIMWNCLCPMLWSCLCVLMV